MRCERCAVPRLKASYLHTKTVHDSPRRSVVRVPDSDQFLDGKTLESESCHATSGFNC